MAILIYGEHAEGKLKKATLEAASFASKLAKGQGDAVHAVVFGPIGQDELLKLGQYGVSTVHHVGGGEFAKFDSQAVAAGIAQAAESIGANSVVLSQSYNGRAAAPRVAVRLKAALFSGIGTLPTQGGAGTQAKRVVYSNKGVQTISTSSSKIVYTLRPNAFQPEENPVQAVVEAFVFSTPANPAYVVKGVEKFADEVSLTEADVVVSAGRGMKGPENWGMIEELAHLLGAATACSKPVADIDWRPHHEHVGQTGIQIAPNVYIAVGISGAIQHLAGVSGSKTIIVINKDPEAPFFKAADYGVVGDAFDVVPRLIDAVKQYKASH